MRVEQVRIDLRIRGTGVIPNCELRLTADAATISARFALDPDSVDPRRIDLSESAPIQTTFDDFDRNFTGGICSNALIEDVINEIVSNLKDDIRDALAGVEIAGPIGGWPSGSISRPRSPTCSRTIRG